MNRPALPEAAAPTPRPQIDEDLRQQRLEWRLHRIAWPLLCALLVAIACGALGQGPLADARLDEANNDGLRMDYRRLLRREVRETLRLTLPGAAAGLQRLTLDNAYLDRVTLEHVFPPPQQTLAGTDGTTFVFALHDAGPLPVRIEIEPRQAGRLDGWLALNGQARRHFSQFVWP